MLVVAVVVLIVIWLTWSSTRKPAGYPPGPFRLPQVGYALYVKEGKPHHTWDYLQRKYGDVIGLYMGTMPTILVGGWKAVTEALANHDLDGRPFIPSLAERYGPESGVMFGNGEFWQTQRRFTLHHFRNLGFGKRSHQDIILEEVEELVRQITRHEDAVNVQPLIAVASINILWSMVAGTRYNHDQQSLHKLVRLLNTYFRTGRAQGGLMSVFPMLRHVAPRLLGYAEQKEASDNLVQFVKNSVEEHRKTYQPDVTRDFMDIYLHELRKEGIHESFTDVQMMSVCHDVINAGTETGSSLLAFCVMFLCLAPHWQAALHAELDQLLKDTGLRLPTIDDRDRLPKTEAFLSEVMRFRCPSPVTVPHSARADTTLQGHKIPKGAFVIINLRSVMMDPVYWKDPEVFRPDRFLAEDGSFKKDERLIPFGKGKRRCLGEPLARMTGFLLLAGLASRLSFSPSLDHPIMDTEGITGFTLGPSKFKVLVKNREQILTK